MVRQSDILKHLGQAKVVPVIRMPSEMLARRACEWLAEAGMRALEITYSTPGATALIQELRQRFPDLCIGAGTILNDQDAQQAIEAGAAFIVSPMAAPTVLAACREADIPFLPGAATPTEVMERHQEGAATVKIFPALQAGGPGFLKALKSVFPNIPLMPTGGISPDNAADYFKAGALCIGMGGNLTSVQALEADNPKPVFQTAKRVLEAAGIPTN